ncbi:conserved hypothetical protein [Theileria equi strain WA]|uniref:Uncharacterized protein n=1 Tax=Theileria equi strain WA TaxID=1537102 RepID=L1LFU4_THEEQ|nr:conserved hypothetical protein [Theileria equi strain WA]EKX74282.1 conserved hypothetical protein [Theileria equi strain WA]|eukprot:XP_004833734.1 conserved hypothetical protein [Theileria equi strain WA]
MISSILIFSYCIQFYAWGLSTILYGPGYPNRFACLHDVYGVALSNFRIPEILNTRIVSAPDHVSRVVEGPQDISLERELTQATLRLVRESHMLKNGLIYPDIMESLQMRIAEDYVAAHSAVVSLNTLRVLQYIINTLNAFAKDNVKYSRGLKDDNAKFLVCSAIVYAKVSDKLERQRTKRLQKLKDETKRISFNLTTFGKVKTTGDLSLFKSGFITNNIFVGISIVVTGIFWIM